MDPYQGEGFSDMGGVATQGSGDVGVASPAYQGAGQVAKSCHHLVRLRKAAITWGALPVLTWERSSSKVTSLTQCTRFSMSQCFLRTRNNRFAPPAAGATLVTA